MRQRSSRNLEVKPMLLRFWTRMSLSLRSKHYRESNKVLLLPKLLAILLGGIGWISMLVYCIRTYRQTTTKIQIWRKSMLCSWSRLQEPKHPWDKDPNYLIVTDQNNKYYLAGRLSKRRSLVLVQYTPRPPLWPQEAAHHSSLDQRLSKMMSNAAPKTSRSIPVIIWNSIIEHENRWIVK